MVFNNNVLSEDYEKYNIPRKYPRAGPHKYIYHKPESSKALIVTCGGLCPGLNSVIRELVMSLYNNYGVKEVYGIRYGYKGFYSYDFL